MFKARQEDPLTKEIGGTEKRRWGRPEDLGYLVLLEEEHHCSEDLGSEVGEQLAGRETAVITGMCSGFHKPIIHKPEPFSLLSMDKST